MKVIKHGNTVKELTCPECGCIFLAGDADATYSAHSSTQGYHVTYHVAHFYHCPECGHECGEEDMKNEQR